MITISNWHATSCLKSFQKWTTVHETSNWTTLVINTPHTPVSSWWRHQMETFFALRIPCEGNSPVTGEFPSQRPVMRSFDIFFDLLLIKQWSKQSRRRWFETPSRSLRRHCNASANYRFLHVTEIVLCVCILVSALYFWIFSQTNIYIFWKCNWTDH